MKRPLGPRGTVYEQLRERNHLEEGEDPGRFDPHQIKRVEAGLGWLYGPGRYFDTHLEGFEHVPPPPTLLVSNHSGGTMIPDVWGLGLLWYRKFGPERPLYVLAHELLFATSATGRFFEKGGVLRASPEVALRVLRERRADLLVLPGGDQDAWRPWRDRYRVNFAGHTGYARLAIESQVPVVPVSHAGAQETLLVLSSGKRLARLLGLHRLARAEIWPVHLSLPWGLAIGPLPHLPMPARFDYLLGAPILPPAAASDQAELVLDAQVRQAVQHGLDVLESRRPPWPRRALRTSAPRGEP